MKLTTQDGRTIELSREYQLSISGYLKNGSHKSQVTVKTFTKSKWDDVPFSERHLHRGYETFPKHELVEDYGIVGEYSTDTGRAQVVKALDEAWKNGASEFTMPQDTFTKSEYEQVSDFAEEHGLTMLLLGEPGYTQKERAKCARLAQETDYWERRNCLVSDGHGSYKASLAKWKALNPEAAALTA